MELFGDEKIFDLELVDGTTVKALGFWGNESPFSNFYPCEISILYQNKERVLQTSEHLFMTFKANRFDDLDAIEKIINAQSPMKAKSIGRSVKKYDDDAWRVERYTYMVQTLVLKFAQNDELRERLLATGDIHLVEASPYDAIWGVKLKVDDPKILKQSEWKGKNLLGEALMHAREIFKD